VNYERIVDDVIEEHREYPFPFDQMLVIAKAVPEPSPVRQ
jgi:hypothetical protein